MPDVIRQDIHRVIQKRFRMITPGHNKKSGPENTFLINQIKLTDLNVPISELKMLPLL
jgi:hypothetical protein